MARTNEKCKEDKILGVKLSIIAKAVVNTKIIVDFPYDIWVYEDELDDWEGEVSFDNSEFVEFLKNKVYENACDDSSYIIRCMFESSFGAEDCECEIDQNVKIKEPSRG